MQRPLSKQTLVAAHSIVVIVVDVHGSREKSFSPSDVNGHAVVLISRPVLHSVGRDNVADVCDGLVPCGLGLGVAIGIASGSRRRSSGAEPLVSQFLMIIRPSVVASAIVQSRSRKHVRRSSNTTKSGTARRHLFRGSRSPQPAASARIGALLRTQIERSDVASTLDNGLRSTKLSSVKGSVDIDEIDMMESITQARAYLALEWRLEGGQCR
jgi:hypothetical protein